MAAFPDREMETGARARVRRRGSVHPATARPRAGALTLGPAGRCSVFFPRVLLLPSIGGYWSGSMLRLESQAACYRALRNRAYLGMRDGTLSIPAINAAEDDDGLLNDTPVG